MYESLLIHFELKNSSILGPSSPDSVATSEKKFGRTFSWVCMVFKKLAKKVEFCQNRIYFTNVLIVLTKKKQVFCI